MERAQATARLKRALVSRPLLYGTAWRARLWADYLRGVPHDPDYYAFGILRGSRHGVFLDVGANVGMSALSFRTQDHTTPIVSIEANPAHERDLRAVARVVRDFRFELVGAGAEAGQFTLSVPTLHGTALTGMASGDRETLDDTLDWWVAETFGAGADVELDLREVTVDVIPLDELRLTPAYVKIDVEGLELDVVRGLRETIDAHHPLLLVERSACTPDIAGLLEPDGYRPYRYDVDLRRFRPDDSFSTTNVFLAPSDWPLPLARSSAVAPLALPST